MINFAIHVSCSKIDQRQKLYQSDYSTHTFYLNSDDLFVIGLHLEIDEREAQRDGRMPHLVRPI